jgi:hypothetical protein
MCFRCVFCWVFKICVDRKITAARWPIKSSHVKIFAEQVIQRPRRAQFYNGGLNLTKKTSKNSESGPIILIN